MPDDSGRLMVPDMNDILYLVDKDTGDHVPYLNVRDRFIDNFHNHAGLGTGLGFAEFHPEFAENGIFYTVHTEAGSALTDEPDFPEYGTTGSTGVWTEWTDDPSAETFEGISREVMRFLFAGRVHTVQQIASTPRSIRTMPTTATFISSSAMVGTASATQPAGPRLRTGRSCASTLPAMTARTASTAFRTTIPSSTSRVRCRRSMQ